MADNLLIVESPAKMRTIGKYLGKSFKVDASMGHAIDLPVRELGIDVEKNFEPKYVTMKGKGKILQKLRQEAGKVSTVYLATDPDREGEAIAWHIAGALKNKKCEIKRITFNEISKKAVTEAIEHPSEINMDLVNAQQARRILDRLVGYKVSPFLWKTIYRGLSAGRVQTVALRMICEREQEIRKFKPDEYWTLDAELAKKSGEQFSCSLQKIDGKKAELKTGNETQSVIDRVKPGPFTVVSVSKKKKKRNPSPPFITSTMQQEAARKLHFSASKTMFLAQQLYEGLEINGESTGLITYMRTDSFRIADAASEQAENFIASEFGKEYLPEKRPYYKKSGKTQDAHEAVRPVNPVKEFSPETVKKSLSRDQFRLYELIWKRFMASRMAPAEYDATSCDIESGGCLFRATGLITRFKGFTILYTESSDNGKSGSEESFLPELLENENLELVKLIDKQHFTQPPPRYSEASLVKELEKQGIGRPSTYSQIIDTLKKREYVKTDKRRFASTTLGETIINILIKTFPDLFNISFTADMESHLDKIETGEDNWLKILDDFYSPFSENLKKAQKQIPDLKESLTEDSGKKCDKCGGKMLKKWGRNGQFLACSEYPKCKNTSPLDEDKPPETDEKCDKCGAPMTVKQWKRGRFLGCSTYPACRNTKPFPTGVKCPEENCGGYIAERYSSKGKVFFSCSNYPECKFALWNKPVNEKCPSCGNSYMTEKTTKAKGFHYYCPKCRHIVQKENEDAE